VRTNPAARRRRRARSGLLVLAASLALAARVGVGDGGDREEKLRRDRERVEAQGFWIYDDLAKATAEARESGKPLAVVLRCVPCEECVKLDDALVDADPRVRPLLERFVRARVVSTNGLDLATFQFDTDQSFAVFLLRADGTVYGRFGTRSHRTAWADDVSVEGLAAALEGALEMHAAWPRDREALASKRGPAPAHATPERYPSLRDRYRATLAAEGKVAPSCIHCHMIGEADRAERLERGALPEEVLFPHPHPKAVGLVLDPARRAVVREVAAGSAAAAAGFRPGDELLAVGGAPPLSIADVQWALHRVPARGGTLEARVRRDGKAVTATLTLAEGWRRADDLSWRATTWPLRRFALGGMKLDPVPEGDPARDAVPAGRRGGPLLRVGHVGQYAPHDRAKRAGFRRGDVLLSFDGREDLERETDVIRLGLEPERRARPVPVRVLREGKTLTIALPPQ
jgi:hypothetical protein